MDKTSAQEVYNALSTFFRASEKGRFFDQLAMGYPVIDKPFKSQLVK